MIGLIIAVSVVGVLCISSTVFGAIKIHKMEKNMTTLAECLLTYMAHPERIDIIEDCPVKHSDNDFNFPNSTGF